MRARAAWAARLPLPCTHCLELVRPGDPFDLEHDPPRALGGTEVVGVAHPSCNRSAGALLGATLRAADPLGDVDRTW